MPYPLNTFSIAAITAAVQKAPMDQRGAIEAYLLANTDRTVCPAAIIMLMR